MGDRVKKVTRPRGALLTLSPIHSVTPSLAVADPLQSHAHMGWLLIHLIIAYRATLGPYLGGQCRFVPTCSQYAIDAIEKYGAIRGGWRALKRISRCHPRGGHGVDPPQIKPGGRTDMCRAKT